jgi:hypothetical protein
VVGFISSKNKVFFEYLCNLTVKNAILTKKVKLEPLLFEISTSKI